MPFLFIKNQHGFTTAEAHSQLYKSLTLKGLIGSEVNIACTGNLKTIDCCCFFNIVCVTFIWALLMWCFIDRYRYSNIEAFLELYKILEFEGTTIILF